MELVTAVAADPARVWELVLDVTGWPALTPSITAVERLEDGPLAVGSRTRVQQPRLGRVVWTVTALDPGRSFAWESATLGVRTVGTDTVAAADGGSRLTLSVEHHGPLAPVVRLLTGRQTARYVGQEAAGIAAAATR